MFNNTDDIVIFNNYNGDELNIIGNILNTKMHNISEVKRVFNLFTQKTFGLDPVDNIIFPNDNNISLKSYRIYLHRMVRFIIDKHAWSGVREKNQTEYYKNVVNMPTVFLEYLREYVNLNF